MKAYLGETQPVPSEYCDISNCFIQKGCYTCYSYLKICINYMHFFIFCLYFLLLADIFIYLTGISKGQVVGPDNVLLL